MNLLNSIFKVVVVLLLLGCTSKIDKLPEQNELLLSGDDWLLLGLDEGEGIRREMYLKDFPIKTAIPSIVPGDIYADLERVGKLSNLYYGLNARKADWVSAKEWWYRKVFTIPMNWKDKKIRICFDAVDYETEIWLNGHYLGKHEGQFTPFYFEISDKILRNEKNVLTVLIHPVPKAVRETIDKDGFEWNIMREMRSSYSHWKSMTSSGWDWGIGLVSMGIWQDVKLVATDNVYLSNLEVLPQISYPYKEANLTVQINAQSYFNKEMLLECVIHSLTTDDSPIHISKKIYIEKGDQIVKFNAKIEKPNLWWPNGYGEQHLYEVSVCLKDLKSDFSLDLISTTFGIRDLRIVKNPRSSMNASFMDYNPNYVPGRIVDYKDTIALNNNYLMEINGVKIMGMGANWLPVDLLFGRPNKQNYEYLIRLAAESGINLLRVWGGGIVEKKIFFDLCDKYGIMLFYEFPNAGYKLPETKGALQIVEKEVKEILPLLINHPSIVRYGAGNEQYICDSNSKQIALLRRLCNKFDPSRPFYTSDPEVLGQRHGPHGYIYDSHYLTYNSGYPLTPGSDDPNEWTEYGASGLSSLETLKKIIPESHLFPIPDNDPYWIWHNAQNAYGSDNWLASSQYEMLFGKLSTIESTIRCSQFIQAEGIRYANQSMRRNMWHRSSFLSWTYNEPWPNAAHGCLVEYYGKPKMALYYTKKTCNLIDISCVYDNLECSPDKPLNLELWVSNLLQNELKQCRYRWTIFNTKGELMWREERLIDIAALKSNIIGKIEWRPTLDMNGDVALVYVELVDSVNNALADHLYTFGIRGYESFTKERKALLQRLLVMPFTKYEIVKKSVKCVNPDEMELSFEIKNVGNNNGLFVSMDTDVEFKDLIFFDQNYIFIPKGESKIIKVKIVKMEHEIKLSSIRFSLSSWNSEVKYFNIPLTSSLSR